MVALATGQKSAKVPWDRISKDPTEFFDKRYLPIGFKFCDPSRMGVSVKDLVVHLRKIQDDDTEIKFHFRNVLDKNEVCPAIYPDSLLLAFKGKSRAKGKAREQSPGLQVINSEVFNQMFQSPAKSAVAPSPSPQKTSPIDNTPTTTKTTLKNAAESAAGTLKMEFRTEVNSLPTDPFDQRAINDPFDGVASHSMMSQAHARIPYEPGPPQTHNGFTNVNPQSNLYHPSTNLPIYPMTSTSFTFPTGMQDPSGQPVQYPIYPGHHPTTVYPPFDPHYQGFPVNQPYHHGAGYLNFRPGPTYGPVGPSSHAEMTKLQNVDSRIPQRDIPIDPVLTPQRPGKRKELHPSPTEETPTPGKKRGRPKKLANTPRRATALKDPKSLPLVELRRSSRSPLKKKAADEE